MSHKKKGITLKVDFVNDIKLPAILMEKQLTHPLKILTEDVL